MIRNGVNGVFPLRSRLTSQTPSRVHPLAVSLPDTLTRCTSPFTGQGAICTEESSRFYHMYVECSSEEPS